MSVHPKDREAARRGRMGAHALHSRYDSRITSAPGRAAFLARFERDVDPDGQLDPEERRKRARHALKLRMAQVRQGKKMKVAP